MATASVRSKLSRNDNKELTASIPVNETIELLGSAHVFDDVTFGEAGILQNELKQEFYNRYRNNNMWRDLPLLWYALDQQVNTGLQKYTDLSVKRFGGIKYDFIYNRSILGILAENRLFKHLCQVFDEVKIMGFDLTADVVNLNVFNVDSTVGMIIPEVTFRAKQRSWNVQFDGNNNTCTFTSNIDNNNIIFATNDYETLKKNLTDIAGNDCYEKFCEAVADRIISLDNVNIDVQKKEQMLKAAYNMLNYDCLKNGVFDREVLLMTYLFTFGCLFSDNDIYGGATLQNLNFLLDPIKRANPQFVQDVFVNNRFNGAYNLGIVNNVEPFVNFYFGAKRQHPNYTEMADIVNRAWNIRNGDLFMTEPGENYVVNRHTYKYGVFGEYSRNCMDLEDLKCLASTKKCSKLPGCGMHLELAMLGSSNSEKMLTFPTALFASLTHFISADQNGRFAPLLAIGAETVFDANYVHGTEINFNQLEYRNYASYWRRLTQIYRSNGMVDVPMFTNANIEQMVNMDLITSVMDYGSLRTGDYQYKWMWEQIADSSNIDSVNNKTSNEYNLYRMLFNDVDWWNFNPVDYNQGVNILNLPKVRSKGLWTGSLFSKNFTLNCSQAEGNFLERILPRFYIEMDKSIVVKKKYGTEDLIQQIYNSLNRLYNGPEYNVLNRLKHFDQMVTNVINEHHVVPVAGGRAERIINFIGTAFHDAYVNAQLVGDNGRRFGFGLYQMRLNRNMSDYDSLWIEMMDKLLDVVKMTDNDTRLKINIHGDIGVRMKRMRNLVVNSTAQEPAFLMGTLLLQQIVPPNLVGQAPHVMPRAQAQQVRDQNRQAMDTDDSTINTPSDLNPTTVPAQQSTSEPDKNGDNISDNIGRDKGTFIKAWETLLNKKRVDAITTLGKFVFFDMIDRGALRQASIFSLIYHRLLDFFNPITKEMLDVIEDLMDIDNLLVYQEGIDDPESNEYKEMLELQKSYYVRCRKNLGNLISDEDKKIYNMLETAYNEKRFVDIIACSIVPSLKNKTDLTLWNEETKSKLIDVDYKLYVDNEELYRSLVRTDSHMRIYALILGMLNRDKPNYLDNMLVYLSQLDLDDSDDRKGKALASIINEVRSEIVPDFTVFMNYHKYDFGVTSDETKLNMALSGLTSSYSEEEINEIMYNDGAFDNAKFYANRQATRSMVIENDSGDYDIDVSGVRSTFLHEELMKSAMRNGSLEKAVKYIEQQFCIPLNKLKPNVPFNIGAFTAVLKVIPKNERELGALVNGTKEFITDSTKEAIGVFLAGHKGLGTTVQSVFGINPVNFAGSITGTLVDMALDHAIVIYSDFFKNEWNILKEFVGGFSMNEEISASDNILRFAQKTVNNFVGIFTNNFLFQKVIPWAKDWINFPE